MTHEEKLEIARQRHGKEFRTQTKITRVTAPSPRLLEIERRATGTNIIAIRKRHDQDR